MPDDPTPPADDTALPEEQEATSYECAFPIVALGASAGGLTSLVQFFKALPPETGLAYVVASHLSPDRESSLADILARATKMPVSEACDNQAVRRDHVYVMPPGRDMVITQGRLRLRPLENGTRHHRIDQFFRSMAEDCGHKSVAVVLSGSGSDGALGVEAIKAEGGITFAQDESAEHDPMPRNAIATGCVDFVLPPEQIAVEVARIARHPYVGTEEERGRTPWPGHARITEIVRRSSGVDFTHYKSNTMYRRITRRMVLHRVETAEDYEEMLRRSPEEVESLYQDLLINVTSFFRNADAFDTLAAKIFPRLLAGRPPHEPVRVWALGCSTGEEAYSLAMVFAECAEAMESPAQLQIFATDLSASAIEKARAGLYPRSIDQDVSPERLRRFFVEEEGGYRICKTIREQCIFSRHNALTDPPFSRLDFISCRNVLIYLEPVLQQQIMARLHYALKTGAYLWLGSSESVGAARALFDVEIGRHKIFTRRAGPTPPSPRFRQASVPMGGVLNSAPPAAQTPPHAELHREAERLLLSRYAPPGVVISPDMEIVQFRGDTGAYLAPAPGSPSLNLLKMLREGLLLGVRSLLRRAAEEGRSVRDEGLRVKTNGEFKEVAVEVIPLKGSGKEAGFVVLFDSGHEAIKAEPAPSPGDPDDEIRRLTQELETTRDYLQSVIEHQEAVNEELQSANEEAQSANEEMQSINEELETSKEEIQSTNEELATVNDELTTRNLELARLSNDLNNVLVSVSMPIVIFGADLHIRRFTPAAEKALDLADGDVGRALGSVKLSLAIPDLEPMLREVIATGYPREKDVQDMQGRWCSLRARPYQTAEHVNEGVVMTLVDIDALMRARDYAESILAGVPMPMVVLNAQLRVRRASVSFYETFRVSPEATEGRFIHDLGNGQWNLPELRAQLEQVLPGKTELQDFEVTHVFERIGRRIMLLNARPLAQPAANEPLIVLSIRDITEHRALEESLIERAALLAQADRSKDEFLAMLAHELRNPLAPLRNAAEILRAEDASPEERAQVVEMLGRQIGNMSRMIDDLLDVSRITEGKIELRRQPVALEEIITSAASAARPSLAARSQDLVVVLPEEPVILNADATRLEQVLGNLIGNASKYSGDGSRILVEAERCINAEPPEVVVRITDEGIGIPKELLPRVFDLFMQASRALDRTYGGLGIGLTLVQRLVRQHGGSVEAHSDGPGRGSTFVVRLPLQPGHTIPSAPAPSPQSERPKRMLIVDDNQDSARSMATLQRRRGHETRIACTGLEALTVAAEFHPDVVLLDIGLPRMDGFEVARQLRAMPAMDGVLLLAMSGYGCASDLEKAKQAGFDDYFIKPVDLDRLRECLRKHPGTGASAAA